MASINHSLRYPSTTVELDECSECSRAQGWCLSWRDKTSTQNRLRKITLSYRLIRISEFNGSVLLSPEPSCTLFDVMGKHDSGTLAFTGTTTNTATSSSSSSSSSSSGGGGGGRSSSTNSSTSKGGFKVNPNWIPDEIEWPKTLRQSYRRCKKASNPGAIHLEDEMFDSKCRICFSSNDRNGKDSWEKFFEYLT
jgi:hypothetical protein